MRLCRFDTDRLGLIRAAAVHDVTAALQGLTATRWPRPLTDPLLERLDELRPALERAAADSQGIPIAQCHLHSPVAAPGKIVAVRQNFTGAVGSGPELFLKAGSSVIGPGDTLAPPMATRASQVEVELAAVIGRQCRSLEPSRALEHVAGYCVALDLSVVGDEDRSLRKSPDGFCVLGPWLTTADSVGDEGHLDMELAVDGRSVLSGSTAERRYDTARLLAAASQWFTLYPGDVLLTGSPGSAAVSAGSRMVARIDGLGELAIDVATPGSG